MIELVLPTPSLRRAGVRLVEPHQRLMAAVLQTAVDDCRVGPGVPAGCHGVQRAIAYVASTDRGWPFSFENLCEALGVNAGCLRQELKKGPGPAV